MEPQISIIITAKNEERNIRAAVESALRAADAVPCEIILVDSFSTDRTVEIARAYPIRIVRLRKDWFHSNSAGRFTGARHAHGPYVYFLDGDMVLNPPFPRQALEFLESNPPCAAAMGILEDHLPFGATRKKFGGEPFAGFCETQPSRIKYIQGGGFYRREALLEAGNFDPYLPAEEEIDLSLRLRQRHHDLYYLPILAVDHYGRSATYWREVFRRVRRNLYGGLGIYLRRSLHEPWRREILLRYWKFLAAIAQTMASGLLLLGALWLKMPELAELALIEEGLALAANSLAKRNFRDGLRAYLTQKIIGLCLAKGFFAKKSGTEYPRDAEVIQD